MPKEITHWTLAEQTRKQLAKDSALREIIDNHIHLYYIGAVILDTPFYCLWGSNKQLLMKTAQHFHNHKGNGLLPVQQIVNHKGFQMSGPAWALALGMVTHIWSDATFHPLINHFSGSKKNPAQRKQAKYRHHYLETMLDLHFVNQEDLINQFRFERSYTSKNLDEETFLKTLSLIYWNSGEPRDTILKKALRFHSFVQKSFLKKWPAGILKILNLIPRINLKASIALFYPRTTHLNLPFFNQSISYRHPLTGQEMTSSIDQLTKTCLTHIGATFETIDKCITQGECPQILQAHVAPNLNTGTLHSLAEEMEYFDTSTDIKELVLNGL